MTGSSQQFKPDIHQQIKVQIGLFTRLLPGQQARALCIICQSKFIILHSMGYPPFIRYQVTSCDKLITFMIVQVL